MKKWICAVLSVLLAVTALSGCSVEVQEDNNTDSSYYFYDMNQEETDLVRESYQPERATVDVMMSDMMEHYNDRLTETEETVSLLPEGVQMNTSVDGGLLVVNFNSAYKDMSRAREILVRVGVVRTFLQIPDVSSVRFTVDGAELTDSREQPVGEMTAASFAEFGGNDAESYTSSTFTLYFTDSEGQNLVEEQRTVRYKRNLPKERIILEQLLRGPLEKGHYPTVPESTRILDVTISDRTCYITFDSVFSSYALNVSEEIPIYSVVNSILASVEADRVKITVGKNEEGTFGQNMPLYQFYERNDALVMTGE